MRLHLTSSGNVALLEPSDFRRLDVLVDPQPAHRLQRSLARIGRRADDDHVWIGSAILRFLSPLAGEADWDAGFARMLEHAERRGWRGPDGEVRAHLTPATAGDAVSQDDFRSVMRALPAGISIVSTGSGEAVAGVVVSSLTSISAEPPLVGFFLHEQASCWPILRDCGRFVANVIGEEHREVMTAFLKLPQGTERFSVGQWRAGEASVPVLADALASIECDVVFTQLIATHRMVVGRIRRTARGQARPVVHFDAATFTLEPARAA